jgi:hypothetical protein
MIFLLSQPFTDDSSLPATMAQMTLSAKRRPTRQRNEKSPVRKKQGHQRINSITLSGGGNDFKARRYNLHDAPIGRQIAASMVPAGLRHIQTETLSKCSKSKS